MTAVLGFYGGVGSVTGANFLLDTGKAAFLVDCGLVQGDKFASERNAEAFPYNPADINFLLVTHAHADHIGRIPKLVADGFTGTIYSTTATKDLSAVMLEDAYRVMEVEAKANQTEILYEVGDIKHALDLWQTVDYDEALSLPDDVTAVFTDAGHILGSAMIHLTRNNRKIVFTGDIGNVPQPLLRAPVIPQDYHYLVMESVYGDRQHEQVAERTELLEYYIKQVQKRNSTLIIPAFSLERTQAMLYEINNLVESGALMPLPVFLDSPLAIAVTSIYRRYTNYLRPEIRDQIKRGDDIFSFAGLSFTETVRDSKRIKSVTGAKVIIAGSGMSHGGRIRRHEQDYLGDPDTIVLLVGYQSVGSIGRLLLDGARNVTIDGKKVKVRAQIEQIQGFSGHADRDQLVELVAYGSQKVEEVFVTMGEERSSLFLTQRLRDYLGVNARAPEAHEEVTINF
jgi:metallo-beta-lactamase family protein